MSFASPEGVNRLQAHQKMLDIASNDLANVNSTASKSNQITFSELLSETIKKALQPTTLEGTDTQQKISDVGTVGISPNMAQSNIVNTGNPLDLAIEGEGYFVLSNGSENIYTRAGAFAVDANSNLVDPATGYLVQRVGSVGESYGFQIIGNSNIRVPYDVAMAANATSTVKVAGNLSADATLATPQTNVLTSNRAFTTNNGDTASGSTLLTALDQYTSGTLNSATITVSGYGPSGNALTDASGLSVTATTDLDDVIEHLNDNVLTSTGQVASLVKGKIRITDVASGYSLSDVKLTFANSGTAKLTMPAYFEISTVGGEEVKDINITVYDSEGGKHVLSGAFVRTDTDNTWDIVLTSITGNIHEITNDNRRIRGIEFDASGGSYKGLNSTIGDSAEFVVTFAQDTSNPQAITMSLGTVGQFDGLTQFAGDSTAVAREQDGYEAGSLSTVSVNNEGILIGSFSNGIKKSIATIQVALFQNASDLESVGSGYFVPSANSGGAVTTQAMSGGAGSIHGGALEKSNADVASDFVTMMNAQNSFQANTRTIRVANDVLRELTKLVR